MPALKIQSEMNTFILSIEPFIQAHRISYGDPSIFEKTNFDYFVLR